MSRRALVTGGAGFIGSHLVDRLVDERWEVLVVDDLSKGRLDNLAQARRTGRMDFHQLDLRARELETVAGRFGPQVMFHLAAQSAVRPSVDDPQFDASVNILGTINLLQAGRAGGVERVVFASSGGAIYGEGVPLPARESYPKQPSSPYGISKKVVEDYFRFFGEEYGIDYVLLGLANVFGPRQDPLGEGGVVAIFSRAMLDGRRPVIFGDGSQTRDYVYVQDVVDAFLRAAHRGGGRLFNIGTGWETSVLELYRLLGELTGYDGSPEFAERKPGDVQRSVVDASAARQHLGWEPWTSLEKGLAETVHWFREN
ncbi:MAG: GDP-mannose 4,6-dehydratase [Actinomycetota bacterium]|nr:GDP-mannose 4,6-dehydratase [Actinomycetota bacterium]